MIPNQPQQPVYAAAQATTSQTIPFMQLNEALAAEAGKSSIIDSSGAYIVTLGKALYSVAKTTGSKGIEFSGESSVGQALNYLNVYYEAQDGKPMKSGQALISAMMYLLSIQAINLVERAGAWHVAEFEGKTIGIVVERVENNDGAGKWSLQLRNVFDPSSRKTAREIIEGSVAESVDKLVLRFG